MKSPNHLRTLVLALPLWLALCNFATAQTPSTTGTLSVRVRELKTTNGKIVVNLFRKEDDLFGKPYLHRDAAITQTAAMLEFSDLPFGNYVVFAFHDENNNGTLDHNLVHIPKEPMGYSQDWHFGLFSGMPTYEKTKFTFSPNQASVTITLK